MTREEELEKLIREQEADDTSFQAPQPNTVPWHELNDTLGISTPFAQACPVHGYADMVLDARERSGARCRRCHNEHERTMRQVGRRAPRDAQKDRARKRRLYRDDPVFRERQKAASARQRAKMKGEGA